ncbi:MAG TPA: Hsp33 family molecular chaperone HslO [Polyangiaceae bacterium]|nr:Hsp33 family molecular chaperone HslO [Polyangiaceae bacterium]
MPSHPDSVVRAMTDDGAFRVITASTTQTVRGAVRAQGARGKTARTFGDLITGSILFRETMAPELRVQGILKGAKGSGSLVADSHPSGKTRGLVQMRPGTQDIRLESGAVIQMMRTMPSGRINQGVVEVPPLGGISEALMAYMQTSEQVVSMIAVSTVLDARGDVIAAGGYMVQLLPEVGRGPLLVMTERLRDYENIDEQVRDGAFSPSWLLDQLLYGMPFTRLDESALDYACWCDELRVMSALATLSRADIEHLLSTNEVLEISCEYCKSEYRIPPARLRGLLDQS